MPDLLTAPYYEVFVFPEDDSPVHFACNTCRRDVTEEPCQDHAPTAAPGLRLVECDASPRHWAFVHDRDDYGAGCPYCWTADYAERERLARQCKHWGWRRWKLAHWIAGRLYTSGISSGGGSWAMGDGCNGCLATLPRLRGKRVYILFVMREVWRCWLVGRHRRGVEVGFGFCGKCVPWQCCGSVREEHADGCPEGDPRDPSVVAT
jgi:hypothetical protein